MYLWLSSPSLCLSSSAWLPCPMHALTLALLACAWFAHLSTSSRLLKMKWKTIYFSKTNINMICASMRHFVTLCVGNFSSVVSVSPPALPCCCPPRSISGCNTSHHPIQNGLAEHNTSYRECVRQKSNRTSESKDLKSK